MNKYQSALNKITFTIADLSSADEGWIKDSEAVKTIQELVEKATPKKPIHKNTWGYDDIPYTALCPNCEENIGYEAMNYYKYCPVCGQALDWRDEK